MYQQQQSLPTSGSGVRVEPSEMLAEQAGVKRAGAAMMDLGEILAIRGHQIQQDINDQVSAEADEILQKKVLQKKIEYAQRKGRLATATNENGSFNLVTEAEAWHNDAVQEISATLDNDDQRKIFKQMARKSREGLSIYISSHVLKEKEQSTENTRQMALDRTAAEIAGSNGNQQFIDNRIAAYQGVASMLNLDSDTVQRDVTKLQTVVLKSQKEWKVNAALADLKTKHGDNIVAAMQEASSVEFLNKYDAATQGHVRSSLSEDMRVQRLEIDSRQSKLLSEWSGLLGTGKSRATWYRKVEKLADEGKVTDEFMRSAIVMQKQDIQEANTGGETNPVAYTTLHEKVARGGATIGEIMGAKGISFSHKNTLIDKFYSKQGSEVKEAETQAKNYIKSQLVSTGPLGNPLPAEHERLFKAYEAIDVHADAARKAEKPWTVKEYMDYAQQLATFYRPTIESKVRDMNSAFMPTQPAAPKAAPADMKRKPGESIDQYLKRTGQE